MTVDVVSAIIRTDIWRLKKTVARYLIRKIEVSIMAKKAKEKRFKCYYYQLVLEDRNAENNEVTKVTSFEFPRWLKMIKQLGEVKKHVELKDCTAYIDDMQYIEERYYFVRFYKLRSENIPYRIKDGEEAKPIKLDKDEYIGEDTNLLYDTETGLCMVQRNIHSLSVSRLAEWMSKDSEKDKFVVFNPLFDKNKLQRLENRQVKRIELSLANLDEVNVDEDRPLGMITRSLGGYAAYTAKIEISVGRKRNSSLSTNIDKLISDVYNNQDVVVGGKAYIKEPEKPEYEPVDFFESALSDYLSVKVSGNASANFNDMERVMLNAYKKRFPELKKIVGLS